jgi:hypothetical protein
MRLVPFLRAKLVIRVDGLLEGRFQDRPALDGAGDIESVEVTNPKLLTEEKKAVAAE